VANISDKIAQIRQAIYGKDVRESIASGIECINDQETIYEENLTNQQNEYEQNMDVKENIREEQENTRQTNETNRNVYEKYDPNKSYLINNKVTFLGSSYVCKIPCLGVEPTNTDFWLLSSSKGDRGTQGSALTIEKTEYLVSTDGVTNIPLNFTSFNPIDDNLDVNCNGVDLDDGEEYIIANDNLSINLVGWIADSGYKFKFKIYKTSMGFNESDGSLIDENSINITKFSGDVQEKINSVPTLESQMADITINVSQFPRIVPETDDTARFNRAINYLSSIGGGELRLKLETYTLGSIVIPDNISIVGQRNKDPWATTNTTILCFNGTGDFITVQSFYNKRATLKFLNLLTTTSPGRTSPTTAIKICKNDNRWGSSANIEDVTIYQFGTGIYHSLTYNVTINRCNIWDCGTGIVYNAVIGDGSEQDASITFGNENVVENSVIVDCNIGVEFMSDFVNEFRNCDIETNYIGILIHYKNGFLHPTQHIFINCWFEGNGWASDTDRTNNTNPRYLVCNCDIDSNFTALGTNTSLLPTFVNCKDTTNVFPEIPNCISNYLTYLISNENKIRRISNDATLDVVYNYPTDYVERITINNTGEIRDIFNVSNKGMTANIGLNNYESVNTYTPNATESSITNTIMYSDIINPQSQGEINHISSTSLLVVHIDHIDGNYSRAMFLISDIKKTKLLFTQQIGVTETSYGGALGTNGISIINKTINASNIKNFDVSVDGYNISKIIIKMNYLPNGLLL